MEHGQGLDAQLVEAQRLSHRAAAFVHEGRRFQEQQLHSADTAFLQPALELLLHGREPVDLGNGVHCHEAGIVPMQGILRSGIAKAHPQLHRANPSAG